MSCSNGESQGITAILMQRPDHPKPELSMPRPDRQEQGSAANDWRR
jgi:hypothetical protein